MLDVVQVGYGPVGQLLANLLGRAGHTVLALERHTNLYAVSRAGTIDAEAMRTLQRLGLAELLEPKLAPMLGMDLVGADGELTSKVPVDKFSMSGWNGSYQLYQPDLEDLLDSAARSTPGVTVLQGWDVVAFTQHPDRVEVHSINRETGEKRVDEARYLIGADGANSIVRETSGIGWEDFGYVGPWLVCDFEHKDPNVHLPFGAKFDCKPERPTLAGRWLGRRHSRMEFMVLPDEDPARFDDEEVCWKLAAPYGLTRDTSTLVRHAVYQFRSLLAERWRDGRVVLVGDAAHVMPPFMGQGMCSGFRDAANLAWKLDLVLRGAARDDLLDRYVDERRPHVEQVIRASMGLGWLVSVTDPDDAAERDADLRELGLPPVPPFPTLTDGALHHDATGELGVGAGTLGLQSVVRIGGTTGLVDELVGSGWRIFTRRPVDIASLSAPQRALLDELDARVLSVSPVPGAADALDVQMDYDRWFESLAAELIIVRPDFYVYAALADPTELGAALDELRSHLALV
jgi:2-polyprenyl-6-methoxyphenol hydroxylase-like FAD-dependent oxidoreductase